jgi:hypothetical protein
MYILWNLNSFCSQGIPPAEAYMVSAFGESGVCCFIAESGLFFLFFARFFPYLSKLIMFGVDIQ